jgi:hypothetical protein
MSEHEHGHHHNGGLHLGSILLGALLVSWHRLHTQHRRHRRHRRKVSPILRYQLNYRQAMTAINGARVIGLLALGWFVWEYVHMAAQLG